MNRKFHRFACLLLALVMTLALAACGNTDATDPTDTTPVETTVPTEAPTLPSVDVENPATSLNLSYSTETEYWYMYASLDAETGAVYLEYQTADEKKVGELDSSVMDHLTVALSESGLLELEGASVDGIDMGTMSAYYADGTSAVVEFYGEIPGEFLTAYGKMEEAFKAVAVSLPVYVARPQVMGEVNADVLAEIHGILDDAGIQEQDRMMVSEMVMDESFAFNAGLTSAEGITSGASCTHGMNPNIFSMTIVTLENKDMVQTVMDDFETTLAGRHWVCGVPDYALMAHKGNMVVFLIGTDPVFQQTATALENMGWLDSETFPVAR